MKTVLFLTISREDEMNNRTCYEIKPTGEFRICVPPERFSEIVSEIMLKGLAPSVTVGSIEHDPEKTTAISFLMGATPPPSKKSAMQTFLRKKDIPCVGGI